MVTGSPAISVDGLSKRFKDFQAVDDLTFEIPQGGVVGFVGPNGAGKSTTIRMLLGLIRPTSGSGQVLGCSITDPPGFLHRVGALIEAPALYKALSGADNLKVFATLRDLPDKRTEEVLEIVGLFGRRNDRVSAYSLGMKQRLAIAIALMTDPDLLILDEPTNGLDPAGIIEVRELLKGLAQSGKTVFVSSHLLSEIEKQAEHVVVINHGELLFSGRLDSLLAQADQKIRARPERPEDLSSLYGCLADAGLSVEAQSDSVLVAGNEELAAQVNRLASERGITLRELKVETETLEEIFIRVTNDENATS
ncbi:MAG: ABC transporter ATP-binding protein [Chloroflexi bacterium]|nr:ABC transporter ATP-binding protein [Chloroflexota bacterium]